MLRLPYLFAWMFLLTVPAQAEEGSGATPPVVTDGAPASSDAAVTAPVLPAAVVVVEPASAVAPATTSVEPAVVAKPVCPEPPVPVESDTEKLHKQQLQLATRKIELLRTTVKTTMVEKGFLSGLFSSAVNPVDTDLLAEMDSFIDRFPELPETAEVYHLKAQVHKRMADYQSSALNWLVLLAAYPDSSFASDARKGLKELAGDKLKKQAATIKAVMDKLGTLSGERDQRMAAFLDYLGTLRETEFAAPIAAECAAFLVRNRSYADEDRIVHALAHQQMMLSHEVAIYHFSKLLALYPASPLRADSQLSIGSIQRKGLKRYDQAANSFKTVIEKYPDSDEAKQAYEMLANMYDEDMRDYPNAIKNYDVIAARYKDDPVVLRGLQALARIYQDKTNQPMQAIATHRKLADTFKGKEGLEALLKAEKLALYSVRDWKLSIEINERIIAAYPDNDEAVKALYANAGIYEDNLKDREQAIKLYQEVIKRHPKHNLAKEAQRRSAALEQKK